MSEVRVKSLPKQKAFIRAGEREVLYSGAYRAGKSLALCLKALYRVAGQPAAREALVRKHLVTLKATTLRTLLEGDGDTPPILPHGQYDHNKSEKVIRVRGGGEIVYFGLDDPTKIGSYSLSGIGVDEATELNEDDYSALRGRISLKIAGMSNQLYSACNPAAPSHHLCKRFGLGGGHVAAPGTAAIVTRMADNAANLPADYIADAQTWTGIRKQRYVDGLWVASDGLVYDLWNRDTHVRSSASAPTRVVCGVDDGYTNPFVVLRGEVDGDGRLHIAREVYKSGLLMGGKLAALRNMAAGAEAVVIDPSAADLIAEARNDGLPVIAAENAVTDGIGRVLRRLEVAGDGGPRLTVHPSCENMIREMEVYEWKTSKTGMRDAPVKEHDHAADALRYLVGYLDPVNSSIGACLSPDVPRPTAPAENRTLSIMEEMRRLREADPNWGFDDN